MMNRTGWSPVGASATVLVIAVCLSGPSIVVASAASVQENPVLPYQGQLSDQDGRPITPDRSVFMVFRIYERATGGTAEVGRSAPRHRG